MKTLIIELLIILIALILLTPSHCLANDHEEMVHHVAHFGGSYAISMFAYGFYEKALRVNRLQSFIFSAFLTTLIGISYKYMEGVGPIQGLGQAVLWNTAGIAAAGITIKVFDF